MLQIEKLELKDFGVVEGTRIIEYKKGLNVIQASNGKGKTNSLQAIEMLINNSYEGAFEDYINNKASSFFIALNFSINEKKFRISLNCKKTKSTTLSERILIDEEGNELASGEEAIQYMSTLLDPVLTRYALVAKQKPIDNIVSCKDSERLDLFKKFQNLNFETAISSHIMPLIEIVKNDITDINKEIYRLENMKYDFKNTLDQSLTKEDYLSKKIEYQNIIIKNASIAKLKEEHSSKKKSLEDTNKLIENLETSIKNKQVELEKLQKELDILLSVEYSKQEISKIEKEFDEKKVKNTKDISTLTNEYEQKKESIIIFLSETDKEIKELDLKLANLKVVKLSKFDDTELKELENKKTTLESDIKYCDINIKSLEKGICPTCGEKCDNKLSEWVSKKEEYLKELEIVNVNIDAQHTLKKEYDIKVEENLKVKEEKTNVENTLNSKKASKQSLEEKLELIKSSYDKDIENKNNDLNSLELSKKREIEVFNNSLEKDIIHKNSIIENANISLKEYNDSLVSNETTKDSLESWLNKNTLKEEEQDATVLLSEIEKYENIEKENSIIVKNNKELEEKQKQDKSILKEEESKKQNLLEKQKNLEQARTILLKDFPNYVIDQSVANIEQNMNQFISDVYYKSLNISLRATKTSIKLEYGLEDRKLPAHRLSGAESKLVSLAFINNFNKYIGLSCLMLDEPDAAMDVKRQEDMYEILLSMKDIYNQMIIITHSEKMLNYLTSNTEVNIIRL